MPTDCPKPLASSTVGDIAVMVQRTGMIWKEFKPGEGRMIAEGGPYIINSMELRGLGIVLQFRCLDDTLNHNVRESKRKREASQKSISTTTPENSQETQEVGNLRKRLSKRKSQGLLQIKDEEAGRDDCSDDRRKKEFAIKNRIKERLRGFLPGMRSEDDEEEEATDDLSDSFARWSPSKSLNPNQDKMMFGLIPSDPALNIPDFPHATPKECSGVLFDLTGDREMRGFVEKHGRDDFNDLLYLAPEAFRHRGKGSYILQSREHPASVFYNPVSIMAETVKKYLNGEMHAERAQKLPETRKLRPTQIGSNMKEYFQRTFDLLASKSRAKSLDLHEIQIHHEDTTIFFRNLEKKHHLRFQDLLGAHFIMTTNASCKVREENRRLHKYVNDPYGEEWEISKRDKDRPECDDFDDWEYRRQILEICFSKINLKEGFSKFQLYEKPLFHAYWNQRGVSQDTLQQYWEEAWIMLMLRGYLYRELHDFSDEFVEEEYLDHRYYKSKIPVWLG